MTATFLRPDADSSDGSWLNASSSNTDLYASVDESTFDDADYIRSSATDGDTVRLRLSDPLTGVDQPLIVRYRCLSEGFPAQMAGYLTQSTSTSTGLIAYWELEPTDTFATYATTLTTAQFDQITDFNDLYVTFSSVAQAPHLTGNIDLNFQAGTYYELGTVGTKSSTDYLSCSRASIGYAKNADGTLTQFGNDTLRITDLGLLVEDVRTNILYQSQDCTVTGAGGWNSENMNAVSSGNNTTAPDGTNTANKIIPTNSNTNHDFYNTTPSDASGAHSWTVYMKAAEYNFGVLTATDQSPGRFGICVNLTSGAVTSTGTGAIPPTGTITYSTEMMGNGWVRLQIIFSSTGSVYCHVGVSSTGTPTWDSNANASSSCDGTSGIYVWGAQVEAGSFPSSYIPTTTTSATRAADVVTCVGNLNSLLIGTASSVVADAIANVATTNRLAAILGSAGTNDVRIYAGALTNDFDVFTTNASGGSLTAIMGNPPAWLTGAKAAQAQDASNRSLVGGGGTIVSDANPSVPASGDSFLGSRNGAWPWQGYIRRLTVWNTKLADATLQALTAP